MDLEGNLILDRRPARRWVSALAVVIPVVACVAGVTWFVRAFISPPTISIPGPLVLASTAPVPLPAPPSRAEPAAARAESVWPAVVAPPTPTSPYGSPYAQQATLGSATTTNGAFPPAPQSTRVAATTAFTDPARDNPAPAATPSVEAPAMPIAGRIPLPRPRPQVAVAAAAGPHAVPTPRARPAEEEAPAASPNPALNAEPAYGRHSVD
jgi:hypothetical protein